MSTTVQPFALAKDFTAVLDELSGEDDSRPGAPARK
jgi:hypothetical protein